MSLNDNYLWVVGEFKMAVFHILLCSLVGILSLTANYALVCEYNPKTIRGRILKVFAVTFSGVLCIVVMLLVEIELLDKVL